MSLAPPSSQTAGDRPIAFLLDDRDGIGSPVEPVTLNVRPEALTRQDSSRAAVQQTLGGAWVDSFGAGIPTISISGHTGWRRSVGSSQQSAAEDGEARFLRLRDTVFDQWHARRLAAVKSGRDPNNVQLIFADALDGITSVVVPQGFVLQRSRSRPLLMQYQISLIAVSDTLGRASSETALIGAFGDVLSSLGLTSLADSLARIETLAKDVTKFVDTTIGVPVKGFVALTSSVYKQVDKAVRSVDGVASSLIGVAQDISRAGANVFRSIGAIVSLPQRAVALMAQIAAAYTGAFCVLRNALKGVAKYDDFDDLYGASNCSSTSGGRSISPHSLTNTLASILPAAAAPIVSITSAAQSTLRYVARADVVLAPLSVTSLTSSLQAINGGMKVAA